jgi:hypothetical protein
LTRVKEMLLKPYIYGCLASKNLFSTSISKRSVAHLRMSAMAHSTIE